MCARQPRPCQRGGHQCCGAGGGGGTGAGWHRLLALALARSRRLRLREPHRRSPPIAHRPHGTSVLPGQDEVVPGIRTGKNAQSRAPPAPDRGRTGRVGRSNEHCVGEGERTVEDGGLARRSATAPVERGLQMGRPNWPFRTSQRERGSIVRQRRFCHICGVLSTRD